MARYGRLRERFAWLEEARLGYGVVFWVELAVEILNTQNRARIQVSLSLQSDGVPDGSGDVRLRVVQAVDTDLDNVIDGRPGSIGRRWLSSILCLQQMREKGLTRCALVTRVNRCPRRSVVRDSRSCGRPRLRGRRGVCVGCGRGRQSRRGRARPVQLLRAILERGERVRVRVRRRIDREHHPLATMPRLFAVEPERRVATGDRELPGI